MKFKLQYKELEGQDIEITCPMWFGQVTVDIDGKPCPRLVEKQCPYRIVFNDGTVRKLVLRAHFLDPVPSVRLDEQEILLARKLHRVESVFAVLPAGMFLGHGILAVLLGYLVISSNFKILRLNLQGTLKWVLIYAISIVAYLALTVITRFAWAGK